MVVEAGAMKLWPIGRVVAGHSECEVPGDGPARQGRGRGQEPISTIEINEAWAEALDGIEDFSHIWVVWWLDRFDTAPTAQKIHPEGRRELPLVGFFATRSPHRPCPIAITAVRLLERDGARLRVKGLDAFEGTSVIDIKPYLRRGDLIPEATMPDWLERLWRIHEEERQR